MVSKADKVELNALASLAAVQVRYVPIVGRRGERDATSVFEFIARSQKYTAEC